MIAASFYSSNGVWSVWNIGGVWACKHQNIRVKHATLWRNTQPVDCFARSGMALKYSTTIWGNPLRKYCDLTILRRKIDSVEVGIYLTSNPIELLTDSLTQQLNIKKLIMVLRKYLSEEHNPVQFLIHIKYHIGNIINKTSRLGFRLSSP